MDIKNLEIMEIKKPLNFKISIGRIMTLYSVVERCNELDKSSELPRGQHRERQVLKSTNTHPWKIS